MYVIGKKKIFDFSLTITHFYGPDISVNLVGKVSVRANKTRPKNIAIFAVKMNNKQLRVYRGNLELDDSLLLLASPNKEDY